MSRHQISATAHYDFPITDRFGDASIQLTYAYRSKFQTNEVNFACIAAPSPPAVAGSLAYKSCLNRINETPSYDLFNLWAEWQRRLDKSVNLSVFVNNLTDNCSYLAGAGQV